MISPDAGCEIDLRVNSAADGVLMEERLLGLTAKTPGCRVIVEGGMNRPPYPESPGSRRFTPMRRALRSRSGWRCPNSIGAVGPTAISAAALGVPTLDGLGCPGSGAHASHEHILWGHLAQRAALMAGLLETLA